MQIANMIEDYLFVRRERVAIARQTDRERAGEYLLGSAAGSEDGEPDARAATMRALANDEIGAAVMIADAVLPLVFGDAPRPTVAAGEIQL